MKWVIHILWHGQPLCHFSMLAPAGWPRQHRWVARKDAAQANCRPCIDRLAEIQNKKT